MEDGLESADGSYVYGDETYRLVEEQSEHWYVYDGQILLGILKAVPGPERGPFCAVKLAEESDFHDEVTDDWERALDYIIDAESNSLYGN
jgi:hypothetical protein